MGFAGRRRVSLYEKVCFSVPIAVYLVPLGAHLSADLSVCMSECRLLESGKLSLHWEQDPYFCLLRWKSKLLT